MCVNFNLQEARFERAFSRPEVRREYLRACIGRTIDALRLPQGYQARLVLTAMLEQRIEEWESLRDVAVG